MITHFVSGNGWIIGSDLNSKTDKLDKAFRFDSDSASFREESLHDEMRQHLLLR